MAIDESNYFLKEADSIVPSFKINNIIVQRKNIRMFCSVDRDLSSNLGASSWLGSSDFLKYINFYFLLTGELTPEQPRGPVFW